MKGELKGGAEGNEQQGGRKYSCRATSRREALKQLRKKLRESFISDKKGSGSDDYNDEKSVVRLGFK